MRRVNSLIHRLTASSTACRLGFRPKGRSGPPVIGDVKRARPALGLLGPAEGSGSRGSVEKFGLESIVANGESSTGKESIVTPDARSLVGPVAVVAVADGFV